MNFLTNPSFIDFPWHLLSSGSKGIIEPMQNGNTPNKDLPKMSPPSILKNYDEMDIKHFEYERTMAQWNIKRVDILYQQNLEILRDLK